MQRIFVAKGKSIAVLKCSASFNWLPARGSGANDPHLYMSQEMQNGEYSIAGQKSSRP
jgi:hypothetical protein